MPKTLTFLASLMVLATIFVLADWGTAKKEVGSDESFTVSLESGNVFEETSAQNEYFIIIVKPKIGKPVNLSGWSVSLNGGQRLKLPETASEFKQGNINELEEIVTAEESYLIISTGSSPVGVSFRENLCSGLLGQYQNFTPPLPSAPFGYESYNDCFGRRRLEKNFLSNRWRIYLGRQEELWADSKETIIVSDENSQELARFESRPKTFPELTEAVLFFIQAI